MKCYYFTFRSVTAAQRGEGILKRKGIACVLRRTPRWMEVKGCGYCLRVRQRDWRESLELLTGQENGFSGIYMQEESGSVVEVRRDISG